LSLDRVITAGVGVVVLAVMVPWLAPTLIQGLPAADNAQVGDAQSGSSSSNGAGKPDLVPGYSHQVALSADGGGHYLADATINGISVRVMVDTGATIVALTSETARRLGINPAQSSRHVMMSTANGVVSAAVVTLGQVRVGDVDVYDVEAAVLPGDALDINLLGMSFLSKLSRFQSAGGQLVLVQ
jgi:aspartyl protease family protein